MARQLLVLTDKQIERIQAMGAAKVPLGTVARHLEIDRKTLTKAMIRQGYGVWMETAFPSRQGYGTCGGKSADEIRRQNDGEMRKLKPEQIKAPLNVNMSSLYVRSATMPWRHAA